MPELDQHVTMTIINQQLYKLLQVNLRWMSGCLVITTNAKQKFVITLRCLGPR
jgi:hypothetical protein